MRKFKIKTSNKIILALLGGSFLVAAAMLLRIAIFFFFGEPGYVLFVSDKGEPTVRSFDYGNFHSLNAEGFLEIEVEQSELFSVEISATQGVHDRLVVQSTDATLFVSQRYFSTGRGDRVALKVLMPTLKSLTVRGGNSVSVSGFKQPTMQLETKGINEVKADNCRIENLRLAGNGAIDYRLSEIAVKNAALDLFGFGSVKLSMAGGILQGIIDRDVSIDYSGTVTEKKISVRPAEEVSGPQ